MLTVLSRLSEDYTMWLRKNDWRLLLSFFILLIFIFFIGVAGVLQINSITKKIETIANYNIPKYKAIVQMRSANILYSLHLRSYFAWKFSRYLDAAKSSATFEDIDKDIADFRQGLNNYQRLALPDTDSNLAIQLDQYHVELLSRGGKVMAAINRQDNDSVANAVSVGKLLLDFDQQVYLINNFLEKQLESPNLEAIRNYLAQARNERTKRVRNLAIAMFIAFFLGGQIAFLVYRERRRQKQRLVELSRRVVYFEERERQNLSFQIHNQMGQDLSALKIYLGIIENKLGANSELTETKKILVGLIDKMHNISEMLSPPGLDDMGLMPMLDSLIEHYQKLIEARFTFSKPQDELKISRDYSLTLYRIVQETLNNVVKYSKATKVEITLTALEKYLHLVISDNGVGFDYRQFLNRPVRRREDKVKLGLLALKERVEILDGIMEIESFPNTGTRINVKLPLIGERND